MTQHSDEGAVTMFLENLSMLGGALFLTQLGAVTWSLDAWLARRAAPEQAEPRVNGRRGRECSPVDFTPLG